MNTQINQQIDNTLAYLYKDSETDYLRMMKGATRSLFRPLQPSDMKNAYLAISEEQGKELVKMIVRHDMKHIVEFGTSFGISTLFLAKGVRETGGIIITTELIESKALKAVENFKQAGVAEHIELRIGDALETLSDLQHPIDMLLLDGWKDLYLPLFRMLEPLLHARSIVYVDNADMAESRSFLQTVSQNPAYHIQYSFHGKVAIVSMSETSM